VGSILINALNQSIKGRAMQKVNENDQDILNRLAHMAMLERGLEPDFSDAALSELDSIHNPAQSNGSAHIRDMRDLLWASIDNDDSLDLDQLTTAEELTNGRVIIYVAVADVDALVFKDTSIDGHARHNTTSVYTAAHIFPMLPEKLSTDLTSLNEEKDRIAVVVKMVISDDGSIQDSDICRAQVRNKAKLAYNSVASWLDKQGPMPEPIRQVEGLEKNLLIQDKAAQAMRTLRTLHGALSFETIEARPAFIDGQIRALEVEKRNRAKDLIEDFMIAANGVTARFLSTKGFPSIRRQVRTPARWDRIVEIGQEHGFELPAKPDPRSLERFLVEARQKDTLRFPDLSLSIIKLLGPGEYTVEFPGQSLSSGHFGLAIKDYTHSTAPNRRFPDLITQRLLKAALDGMPMPYDAEALDALAKHCTTAEDLVKKVERQVNKSATAMLLESRIGENFIAIVTGAAQKGTWVRLIDHPVEGRLVHGFDGLDVGRKIHVQLLYVDVEKGFIDFKRIR
jgi:exoribonuclease-2